jgi:hypothetical protein
MTIELTNDQKIAIVNQHLTNQAYAAYNVELSIKEANAATTPNAENIANLNTQVININDQIAVLNAELATLTPVPTTE